MTRWIRIKQPQVRQFHRKYPATSALLWLNIVAFLLTWGMGMPEEVLTSWGLTAGALVLEPTGHQLATLITSMFLHGGLLHLATNGLMLGVFGRHLEPRLGTRKYVALYFIAGLVAAGAHLLSDPWSMVPMVGASGALSGLLGAAVLLTPRTRLWVVTPLTLFIPVTLRMASLGVIWICVQLLGLAFTDTAGGGIAYAAHAGGFLGGYLWMRSSSYTGPSSHAGQQTSRPVPADYGVGPSPGPEFGTFFVTDSRGRTFVFHSREG